MVNRYLGDCGLREHRGARAVGVHFVGGRVDEHDRRGPRREPLTLEPEGAPGENGARLDPRIDAARVVGRCRGGDASVGLAGIPDRGRVDEAEQRAGRARQVDHRRDHEGDVAGLLERVAADRAAGVGSARAREVGCRHDVAAGGEIFEQGRVGGCVDRVAVGEDDEGKRMGCGWRGGACRRRREVDGGDDRAARSGRVAVPRRARSGRVDERLLDLRDGVRRRGPSRGGRRGNRGGRRGDRRGRSRRGVPRVHGGARAAVRVARSAGIHGPAPSSCSTILIPCRHCSPRPGASRRRMQARSAELARRIMSHDVATSMHRSLACRQVRTTAESEFQSSDALVESHASAHRCLLRGAEQPRGGAATSRTVAVH